MADDLHPVIELLVKRMESHPDEFSFPHNRWSVALDQVKMWAEGANLTAFEKALSKVRLDQLHKDVMDELLNGDERRAKAREQEIAWLQAQTMQKQQGLANAQLYQQQHYGVAAGSFAELKQSLYLDGEKLDGSILKKIKKAVGL